MNSCRWTLFDFRCFICVTDDSSNTLGNSTDDGDIKLPSAPKDDDDDDDDNVGG